MAGSRKVRPAEAAALALEEHVAAVVAREAAGARHITAALSGGLDSVVLTEILRRCAPRLGLTLDAVHVNHGISPNSDAWESFARRFCARRGIAFESARVRVQGKGGLEAAARAARYAALSAHATGAIALGHHADDQAETILLQMLRGAGARGLSAMGTARRAAATGSLLFVRPLLQVERARIEAYAACRRLRWVEDASNADERLARNFLRRRLLPMLEERFPGARTTLARAAAHIAEAAALLDELADIDAVGAVDGRRLRASALRALGPARAKNLVRRFLSDQGVPAPPSARLEEALRQFREAGRDRTPRIDWGEWSLRAHRGWIELVPVVRSTRGGESLVWRGETRLDLPDGRGHLAARGVRGRGLSRDWLSADVVTVRRRVGGERLRLAAGRPTRTLKNLLQEAGMAPWRRTVMPLVYRGDELAWVPGIGMASEHAAGPGEAGVEFIWEVPPRGLGGI